MGILEREEKSMTPILENPFVNGIRCSKIWKSFENEGGKIYYIPRYDKKFFDWLRQLIVNGRPFTEEEIDIIYRAAQEANSGKFELEQNAKEFLKEA